MTAQQTLNAAQSRYEQERSFIDDNSQYLTSDMEENSETSDPEIHEKYQLMGPFDQPKHRRKKVLNNKKVSDHHAIIPTVELEI